MLAAGVLLVALLFAVPAMVSTYRLRGAAELAPAATEDAATPIDLSSDPLAPVEEDWMGSEETANASAGSGLVAREGPLDCLIQPAQVVEIGSQAIGLIQSVHVERGDQVEAGQVVVELEAAVELAALDVARTRASQKGEVGARQEALALSKKRHKRGSELFAREALSVDTQEELEAQARLAELDLLQAEEAQQLAAMELRHAEALLARRTLRSPISGVVTDRLLQPGEIVDEETVLKIAQVDPLRVDVLMPANLFGAVRPGMRVSVEPEFPVEASVMATVAIVDPIIDAASGTFSVRLDLPNPDRQIPGGLHCAVKFLED